MFKVSELLKATKGSLLEGNPDTAIGGISIDSRQIMAQGAFIAIKGSNFDGHDFIEEAIGKGAKLIIAHGGMRPTTSSKKKTAVIKVRDTTKALGDIARFQRQRFNIPLIAVTGSNGKTTTKEMVAWVLSKRYKVLKNEGTKNNQIGLPLTLLKLDKSCDIAVLEIGTSHFGEVGYLAQICLPNIGVITGIGPAHLEYLRSLKGVFKEKRALLKKLKSPHLAVLNADDGFLKREIAKKNKRKPYVVSFGIKSRADFSASNIKFNSEKAEFLVNRKYKITLNTTGYYNIYNALAAVALGRIFGLGYKEISGRLSAFDFPKGRLKLNKLNKISFLDDTYNSNPASLAQALNALENISVKGRKIFVMGDMLELGEREETFHYQAGRKAANVCDVFITVGRLSKLSAEAAASGLKRRNIFICEDSRQAKDALYNKISLKEEDIVLVKGSRAMKMEEVFVR